MRTVRFIFLCLLFVITGGYTQAQAEDPQVLDPRESGIPEPAPSETIVGNDPPSASPTVDSSEPSIEFPIAPDRTRPSTPPPQRDVVRASTGTFDFVAADQGSMQVAKRIGREVLNVCDEILTPPLERIPKISVKLVPEGRGTLGDQPYSIYQDLAGDYGAAVRWNADLPISLFIEVLTESYLRQVVFTLSGRTKSEAVPPWLIAAATLEVQLSFRPELIELLRQIGRDMPMIPLDRVFQSKPLRQMSLQERVAAFWFVQLLEDSAATQKQFRGFFDAVVAGNPPLEVLQNQADRLRGFGNGIEAWWIVGFQDQVHDETGVVFSMARSGKIIFLLDRFELLRESGPEFVGAEGLWEVRDNPLIQQELATRLQQIQSFLPRINPVFYNSLRGLGLVMQTLLDGSREEFDQAVSEFSEEVRQASSLAQDAQLLAEDPLAEIPRGAAPSP